MKRLIITGPRQAQFEDVQQPDCPSDGLVLRARKTAVSTGTEIRVYRARPVDEAGKFLHERVPFVLPAENGYSMLGEVVEAGPETSGSFVPGDRVFAPAPHSEYAAIPASLAVRIPDSITDEQAVFLSILEVGHISVRRGSPEPGASLAVVGAGVIGLSALAFARAFGQRTAMLEMSPARRAIATAMGAELAADPRDEESVDLVIGLFDGKGADVVVEAASVWPAIETGMQVAATDARIVVAARHTDQPAFNPVGHPHLGRKLTLLTSYGYPMEGSRWDRQRSIALTLRLLESGAIDLTPMITHRFTAEEIPEVYRRLDEGDDTMVGVVINWI